MSQLFLKKMVLISLQGLGVGPTADWFAKDTSTTNVPPSGSTRADGVINSGKERRLDVLNTQYEGPIKKSDETLTKADREGLFGENSMEVSSENLLERKEVLAGKDQVSTVLPVHYKITVVSFQENLDFC